MRILKTLRRTLRPGALAGLAGTVGMTALAMKPGGARLLPAGVRPERLLPRRVVRQGARRLGVDPEPAQEAGLTWALHLAYGLLAGAGYGALRTAVRRPPAGLAGAGYGLALWALGYEGWIPALGLLPPTTARRPVRWVVPVGSHLAYGLITALVFEHLSPRATPDSPEAGPASPRPA